MADDPEHEIQRLHDLWRSGTRDNYGWFLVLRHPMTQAARGGIRRMTGEGPSTADIDEAVFRAFKEFLETDPDLIRTPLGLAKRIAFRRGQDVGRRLNRIREFETDDEEALSHMPDPAAVDPEAELVAAEEAVRQAKLQRLAMQCLDDLSPGQAEVVRATVLGDEELSDWALTQGKSYQAADQQRDRGLAALKRCVEAKLAAEGEGGDQRA